MRRIYLSSCLTFVLVSLAVAQEQPRSRPLNMLVLGDSIMWGQGLKREHKAWHLVKVWLEKSTGRPVVENIQAHSGAVLERSAVTEHLSSHDGEVNVFLPTINEQLDSVLRLYPDRSNVDIVLLSGCANDVGSQNLLNAAATAEIDDMTEMKCGPPMVRLLHRVTAAFPSALVIVTGYYPFFSEKTRNDFVLKGLAKRLIKAIRGTPKLNSKQVFERLTLNSYQWYVASNKSLAEAVRKVNAENGGSKQPVVFAKLEFSPDFSFAAPKTHVWNFDRSPLRMMLLFLSFGKIPLPSDDEVRTQRNKSCDELFKKPKDDQRELTSEEKKQQNQRLMLCRYAALGHPNRKGAVLYANTLTNHLQGVRKDLTSRAEPVVPPRSLRSK